jgi:hypothetical protein
MIKIAAGALCVAALLPAAIVIRFSVEDLVDNSQWIVEGRVVRSYSTWDQTHSMIWTHYEVQVNDTLRGSSQNAIVVSEPGGIVDDVGMMSSGAVPYAVGERVVLFLYRTPIGYLRTAGLGQGKFTIGADGRARANLQGSEFAGKLRGTAIGSIDVLALSELKQRIRAMSAARPWRGATP